MLRTQRAIVRPERRQMRKRNFVHSALGEYRELDVTRGNVGTVVVSDAEIKGLMRYLDTAETQDADRKVLELLENMLQLEKMERPLWGESKEEAEFAAKSMVRRGQMVPNPALRKIAPEKYKKELALADKTYSINKTLREYIFLPRVWSTGQRPWVVLWDIIPKATKTSRLRNGIIEVNDGVALRLILDFAKAGLLNRLRKCLHCQKWLYAGFRHQDFCCTNCQQKHYAKSPDWRMKRRNYMREYRRRTM